jgi:hypothetical protein
LFSEKDFVQIGGVEDPNNNKFFRLIKKSEFDFPVGFKGERFGKFESIEDMADGMISNFFFTLILKITFNINLYFLRSSIKWCRIGINFAKY